MLTAAKARELFRYDAESGLLYWRETGKGRGDISLPAGRLNEHGYWIVGVNYRRYRAHRIIWLMEYGEWPTHELDHINGKRDDNRRENLREATHLQNMRNSRRQCSNTSGVSGVSWHSIGKKWAAEIHVMGRKVYLGLHTDIELAELVVSEARRKYFGDFAPQFEGC